MKILLWSLLMGCAGAALAADPDQRLTPLSDPPPAPGFTLQDMDDATHRLQDYAGKPLIVNFWATWCPPCREEMPSMQRAREQLAPDGIELLAINVGEDLDRVFLFLADYPVEFPILFDQDSAVLEHWPVKGLPTTFVLDGQGRIVYRAIGGREWDDPELLRQVRALKTAD